MQVRRDAFSLHTVRIGLFCEIELEIVDLLRGKVGAVPPLAARSFLISRGVTPSLPGVRVALDLLHSKAHQIAVVALGHLDCTALG